MGANGAWTVFSHTLLAAFGEMRCLGLLTQPLEVFANTPTSINSHVEKHVGRE
jgi:hypothetical protein